MRVWCKEIFERGGGIASSIGNYSEVENTRKTKYQFEYNKLIGQGKYASIMRGGEITSIENLGDWEKIPIRVKILFGKMTKGNIPSGERSKFSCERYKFFLDEGAPEISSKCCDVMKKSPVHEYARKTGRMAITAQMATESRLRTQQWLKNGCNGFDMKRPVSNPMAFWTEQDVLLYINLHIKPDFDAKWEEAGKAHGSRRKRARKFLKRWDYIKTGIASVYGDIVTDYHAMGQVDGQMEMADFGIFDLERPLLKTTKCDRTGCMFCGYGCHLEKSSLGRFERMRITHPKIYEYIMKPRKEGGLGYKEVIDWINEHGNLNIRY